MKLRFGLRKWWQLHFGWQWFRGEYSTWAEACVASAGYGETAIVERVLAATLAVRDGRGAFERDGVLFTEPEPEGPLLECLQLVQAAGGGRLRVLDFGGALGTTYWRHRAELPAPPGLVWDIVEQPGFVAAGRRHLAQTPLRFFSSLAEAEAAGGHDLLLCSTVLQYLESPAEAITRWLAARPPYVLLNNLPLHDAGPDRLRVQHVPPEIYPASYPVWFFHRAGLLARFAADYVVLRDFPAEAVWPVDGRMFPSTGLLFKRRDVA